MPRWLPYFESRMAPWLALIAFGNFRDGIIDLAVRCRAKQFDVFGVSPHQRHRGACWPAQPLKNIRHIGLCPALWVGIPAAITQRVFGDALDRSLEIALLFLKKRAAIGYRYCGSLSCGSIDGWIVGFGDDPVPNREPETAGGTVRGADTFLITVCPAQVNPWFSEGLDSVNSVHTHTLALLQVSDVSLNETTLYCSIGLCFCLRKWSLRDRVSCVDGLG